MARRRIPHSELTNPFPEIRVLYLDRNCVLWGIPYLMRSWVGQTPMHLQDAGILQRSDTPKEERWIYLGQPGWIASRDSIRITQILRFREKHKEDIADLSYPGVHLVLPGKEATRETVERLIERYRSLRDSGQCRWRNSDLSRATALLILELEEYLSANASKEYQAVLDKVCQGLAV